MNNFINQVKENSQDYLIDNIFSIVLILIVSYLIFKFGHIFIKKTVKKSLIGNDSSKEAQLKREDTIIQVFNVTLNAIVIIIAGLLVISELGINIGPFLAAAGIAGVALGFGAQYLVRDLITGVFIILENQYRVGDVVCFEKTCGKVENITLRVTTIRDINGTVHYVPNGEIKIASNLTKSKSNVNLDIGVGYDTDLDKVEKVINQVGKDLAKDKEWKEKIRTAPEFVRVNDFGDSAIEVKITGETEPMQQWAVTGELRKRLKKAFDKEGIEIPFPQRDVHIKSEK